MIDSIFSVSEITKLIKLTLEQSPDLNSVWVKGEISNLTYHSSGHIYLSLKDNNSLISAAFFKYANKKLNFRLEEGMNVIAFGGVNVFEKRGTYQFIIADIRLEGIGELLKKIEQLKNKLLEQGIFDPSRKRKIPYLPRRIGIVTSPTGAAIRDIIKVAMRRYPNIEIVIAPAIVQGSEAPQSIVRGIEELNDPAHEIDVIIAGRGGGSFEDLMAFNEEEVVMAFYNSRVPIISAVGHQVDHPLSDDSADYAAPTPSAAAEIAVPMKEELADYIDRLFLQISYGPEYLLREYKSKLKGIDELRMFRNPMEIIHNKELILADFEYKIAVSMKEIINQFRNRLLFLPDITALFRNILKDKLHRLNLAFNSVVNLSPVTILNKGYSISLDENGNAIKSIDSVNKGDIVNVIISDGMFYTTVNNTKKGAGLGSEK
ncbi:MAG: exodeoxyribonuclease VII large subunit [Spirochaetes bacterium]|nr:exodeoxyribonuclease VII large subunit [Spirochaetota bacterium]